MKTLSITAFALIPLLADLLGTVTGCLIFFTVVIGTYAGYKYACRKADQWEREREFDERDIY